MNAPGAGLFNIYFISRELKGEKNRKFLGNSCNQTDVLLMGKMYQIMKYRVESSLGTG